MEYIFTNLPQYVRITPRSEFSSSVVSSGAVLLFSEDGYTLTGKLPDGTFITIGGSGTDVSDTTAGAANVQSGYYFYTSAGVRTEGTLTASGGTDVSDTTATGGTVLTGYDFYNSTGVKTSGTIPTVSAYRSGYLELDIVVPSGYIATQQNFNNVDLFVSALGSTTAEAGDVLSGKVFYNSGGILTTGTMPTVSGGTMTPTTSDQVISSGVYLGGSQVILGDTNLVASNIVSGVSIFGVSGTYQGSGGTMNFYLCESVLDNLAYDVAVSGGGSSPYDGRYMPDGFTSSGWVRWKQTSGGSSVVNPYYLFFKNSFYAQFGSSSEGDGFGTQNQFYVGWKTYDLNGDLVNTTPVVLSSNVWTGRHLVLSGGYYTVDSSGGLSSLTYTNIKPESGKCYSEDAAIVLEDYWREDYGISVNAMGSSWTDSLGSYAIYESFEGTPAPDANGWFNFGSYSIIQYASPGSQEWWEGEGGTGSPWKTSKNSLTVQLDFMLSSVAAETTAIIFGFDNFSLKIDHSGNLSVEQSNIMSISLSYQLAVSTTYRITMIFDRDYCYLIINNILVAQGNSFDNSGAVNLITFGSYSNESQFAIKNAKIWSRAMRNLIPSV